MACAFFAARDADAEKLDALGVQQTLSTFRIGVVRISAVDHDVAFLEKRSEIVDHRIDYRPCRYQQHDPPRHLEAGHETLQIIRRCNKECRTLIHDKLALSIVEIEPCARKPVLRDVQKKVTAHRPEADHPKLSLFHMCCDYTFQTSDFATALS